MNAYLFCKIYRKIDGRFVQISRSVFRTRESTLGFVNGSGTCLNIMVLIAAVALMCANPQVWIDVDIILSREAKIYGIMLGGDA